MDDDNEYKDGDTVWVKLSYCWWPGEVLAGERLTEEFLSTLKRRPLVVVKFFDEDSYEFVKNTNFIYKYNCARKHEFLRKGLEQYRTKNKHMEKFPSDVMHAERATGGDPNIVNSTDYLPQKRENYAALFQPDKSKGKGKIGNTVTTPRPGKKTGSPSKIIPVIPVRKHEVRILAQASSSTGIGTSRRSVPSASSTPSLSQPSSLASTPRLPTPYQSLNSSTDLGTPIGSATALNSSASPAHTYNCHKCGFSSGRQNVILVHIKYCRAVPMVPLSVPPPRAPKAVALTPDKKIHEQSPVKTPTPVDAQELVTEVEIIQDPEELVEVIQVIELPRGRTSRTSRVAATTVTPKTSDRRRNRGRGKAVTSMTLENDGKMDVSTEVAEESIVEEVSNVELKHVSVSPGDKSEKDFKSKPDVELKNELLADWSEDEQDDQEGDLSKEDKSSKKGTPTFEGSRSAIAEAVALNSNTTDNSLDKSTESSPQLSSPVSSGATIKYRNIPKKQKREFIEVTNDQPVITPGGAIEKSSSESSISTAATCGESLSAPDKTPTSSESIAVERPISAKQRILDRATRGSSKSVSSDELKPESPTKVVAMESQPIAAEESRKEISCFDFKEEEDEEVVLSKSPRRSLSNKRDTSLELSTSVMLDDEKERAKKDAQLKNEIDSLLCEAIVPTLPELPGGTKMPSPGPSSSSTEVTPQSKEDRTLPPKERGKRIFKTRNKIIENEAIALEQSKAIVMDFVKKSHEQELAELREQQEAEAKLTSESPTTTNDDSQESIVSIEPTRFENSQFAAIKAKRAKLQQAQKFSVSTPTKVDTPQESAVSSSNETKATETDSLPVSISKNQVALESLQKTPSVSPPISKGRKGKQRKSGTPVVEEEKPIEQTKPETVSPLVDEATPKIRKKRAGELENLDLASLDTPRSRRGRGVKTDEPVFLAEQEPVALKDEPVVAVAAEKHRRTKRAKTDEEEIDVSKMKVAGEQQTIESACAPEELKEETKTSSRSRRSKQLQQQSADSTADMPIEPETAAVETVEKEPEAEILSITKQQPIKMIIKSKGRKSNSELVYDPVVVSPEPNDEVKDKLPKSPKSSKRKKTPVEEDQPMSEVVLNSDKLVGTKPLKLKRPKFRNDLSITADELPKMPAGPSATDLQIAEALIHLPEAAPPKLIVLDQEMAETKANSSSPVQSTAKSINPRKRHLQTHLLSAVETQDLSKTGDNVGIPDKKKRDTIEVVNVAAIVVAEPVVVKPINDRQSTDDDKFDIDNIPIVMDDSELLDDTTISTTTNANSMKLTTPVAVDNEDDDDIKLISTTKPMTKKIVIVKSSNGSAKVIPAREKPSDLVSAVPRKSHTIKSTTVTISPPVDRLSPKAVRSPTHSPPIRSAQLVQSSSGGQIVITSKGTVLTTQSPATSSAKSHAAVTPQTQITHSTSKSPIVSSVCSVSTISSSTSKSLPVSSSSASPRSSSNLTSSIKVKSPIRICVQSQEIIHPPTKPRILAKSSDVLPVTQKVDLSQPRKTSPSIAPPKKALIKKLSEGGSSVGKPLFSTSKGAPITPQTATTSAVSPGKKGHRVIKISPQKLKEFTRLGMVEDKGQGKVLTASGMKKFRQEQHLLQQQQQQQQHQSISKSVKTDKVSRADSIDEEPSTSTPTPPPPSDNQAEVVVAAAADSSVKEIPTIQSETEESPEVTPAESCTQSPAKPASPTAEATSEPVSTEENEADAAVIDEPEPDSEYVDTATGELAPAEIETSEASESIPATAVATEAPVEAAESGSNVQESSQLIAVPAENFGGPANLFYLCSVREEGFVPVNNELLYLDSSNQLVALPEQASVEDIVNQAEVLEIPVGSDQATMVAAAAGDIEGAMEGQQNILLNTQDGQQIILDQQSLMALAAGGDTSQLLTPDGQQILLQGSAQELLAALAVSQPGLGIVAAEGTQIIVAPESLIDLQDTPLPGEIIQVNPNTTVETNAVLTKPPIMSTVEVPTKNGGSGESSSHSPEQKVLETVSTNLDESLAAVIGVSTNSHVPTSLELPITVTNPVIAKTTTSKINPIFPPTTAISAIGIDPAAMAAAVIELPTVAQTGTDSSHVDTLENRSYSDVKIDLDRLSIRTGQSEQLVETNGKTTDEDDDENREVDNENDLDEIIPNTPESQMNSHAEISSQFSDDESEAPVPIPTVAEDDEDDNVSNCSEIIPIQPNVVILRNVNNELINNNDNSSDMEIEHTNPTSGDEENNPVQTSNPEVAVFDGTNSSAVVER
ncbi:mucin-17-like isoform X1 [Topomyia yanbarensis]|uniref:mucin-17-like isoform X1 n=1 Tax=Topomyia yanbarensis TaxID=2498891 RepID=UPI00273CE842|nr:mucin-17-like isoform X1 [Topomyia yanbarensis]XP_058840623.1 mucin-17-like isoform X1 [Topomyia yanbarensis]XP_058840624.1 mucin-17-like isoform X1 [Topomyia yanbarensis]XP_058840625.1 mucin-17-like isoform X1 [Topomyia yanbarensis]